MQRENLAQPGQAIGPAYEITVVGIAGIEAVGGWATFTLYPEKGGLPVVLAVPIRSLPAMISRTAIFMIEQAIDTAVVPVFWH